MEANDERIKPKNNGVRDSMNLKEKACLQQGQDRQPDLTPKSRERTNDPVRMYLGEIGKTPRLTHQGEVKIAKSIERAQKDVVKTLSRSSLVVGTTPGITYLTLDGHRQVIKSESILGVEFSR